MPTRLSDAQRAIILVEALQPFFDEGYAVYLMGPTWAHLERPVSARGAFLLGDLYLAGRLLQADRYMQLTVQG